METREFGGFREEESAVFFVPSKTGIMAVMENEKTFAETETSNEDSLKPHKAGIYEIVVKRLIDIVLCLLVLVLFWWLYLVLAILVRVKLGSPVFFHQDRPGKDGKVFGLLKFRTMTDQRDANGELLPDDVRLTPFGRKLRSTSLDEIPELFNILKGDMSLVGPRPLLVRYLPRYNAHQARRHEVRPGLTGWAQVNGRNAISWAEKFDYDVYYVDHISFLFDLRIIGRTIKTAVVHQDGISSATSATMEEFMGDEEEQKEKSK